MLVVREEYIRQNWKPREPINQAILMKERKLNSSIKKHKLKQLHVDFKDHIIT